MIKEIDWVLEYIGSLIVKRREILCIKEIMMNMKKHRIIDSKQLNVEFDLEIGKN
jgi:hypothetical protein